jgi:hypothetical protein
MLRVIAPVAVAVGIIACSTGPSESSDQSSGELATSLPDAGAKCHCAKCPKGATPQSGDPTTCDDPKMHCHQCTDSGGDVTIAPGQTDLEFYVEASPVGWPDDAHVNFTMLGFPYPNITVTYRQTGQYIPPAQGVVGLFSVSASPSIARGTYPATIYAWSTGPSGTSTQSIPIKIIVTGTCKPKTCWAGSCGSQADGCSGTISCGGCPAGQTCMGNGTCASPNHCPAGTHDCGDGKCVKTPCQ